MANSSFFKNTGTSTQLQGSASASAAAALASEQAALASENAAQTSETNAAASAAAALVSKNAAANSAASANSDASAASISATASQTAATSSSANSALTSADATQTAADRVQTGLDRVATNSDAVQTAADRVQTGLDVTSSSNSAAAALSSRNAAATSETNASASATAAAADAASTAADAVSTAADAASTAADALATAADRVQTGLDATSASNSASAASTSASAASASQIAAASSAASAAAVFSDFEDRYYGPHASDSAAQTHVTGLGLTVDQGDLYFNSTANEMRVYDGGSWVAASSAGGASLINYNYTATASQTAFSGADDNSNTLSYTVDNLIVTKNGIVLEDGTDYTATDGSTITLAVAAAAGDEINVVAFKSFTTADMVSATNGGTFQSNVTVNGTMTATAFSGDGSALTNLPAAGISDVVQDTTPQLGGNLDTNGNDINFGDNDKAIFGAGSDLQIYHNSSNNRSYITESGTGAFVIQGENLILEETGGNNYIQATAGGAVQLYHNGSEKLATTSTGVDVTGTVTASSVGVGAAPNATFGSLLYTQGTPAANKPIVSAYSQGNSNNAGFALFNDSGNRGIWTTGSTMRFTRTYEGNSTADLTIGASGNVGIGSSSPSYKMTIFENGNNFLQFSSTGDAVAGHLIGRAGSKNLRVQNSENANIEFLTNNTERVRIDASGRVTMPYQPSFYAYGAAAYQSQGGSGFAYNTTIFNTGGHYNTSTYRFTAPVAGLYYFSAAAIMQASAADGGVVLVVNGTFRFAKDYTNGSGRSSNVSSVIYLNANDYVFVENEGNSTWYLRDGYGFFSGCLIG